MAPTPVAILDDYAHTAPPYFSKVDNITQTSFSDTIVPSTAETLDALAARLHPFPVISCMRERTPFRAELLSRLPNLKLLLTTGPRNAGIDLDAARRHNIVVAGTTGLRDLPAEKWGALLPYAIDYDATNQQCFSLLLALTSRIAIDDHALKRAGGWQSGLGWGLDGKTFGCVGLGRLGAKAARTAALGFGMKVVAWSASLDQGKADEAGRKLGLAAGTVRAVGKEELLRTADVVSVHYVLSERSAGLIGAQELAAMKSTAVLLNTSRGPIVDEEALLEVLGSGRIRGAGLDVFNVEPLPKDSPWRTTKWGEDGRADVVLSPHMGYATDETMRRWYAEQADTLSKWLQGEALEVVIT